MSSITERNCCFTWFYVVVQMVWTMTDYYEFMTQKHPDQQLYASAGDDTWYGSLILLADVLIFFLVHEHIDGDILFDPHVRGRSI